MSIAVEQERIAKAIHIRVFYNGKELTGWGDADVSILENLESMRVPIRSACRKGRCGSCKVQLVSGFLHPQKQIVENGYVLACSSLLQTDAELVISYL